MTKPEKLKEFTRTPPKASILCLCLLCLLFSLLIPVQEAFPEETGKVAFNFVDVELPVVVKFVSEVTGKNFIFDESLKGKVTIIAPSKLEQKDAFRLFSAILELKGYTLLPSGVDVYKIVHQAKAKQGGTPLLTGPVKRAADETFVARLFTLDYISAREAQNFLKPLISNTGYLAFFGPGNFLLAVDSELNIKKLGKIIEVIDRPSRTADFELVPLKHADAVTVADIITRAFTGAAGAAAAKGQQETGESTVTVVPDERMNAVIMIGDNKARKEQIKELLKLLDQELPRTSGRTKVYFLEYADAEEMAKVLEGLTRGTPVSQPRTAGRGAAKIASAGTAVLSGDVVIVPHKATNSLVITAAPTDYAELAGVIKQLDRRRRQVFVEAVIAEVSVSKIDELGTRWRAALKANDSPIAIGGFGTVDTSTLSDIITGLQGLSIGGMGDFFTTRFTGPDGEETTFRVPGFAALISIDQFRDAIDILSAPTILTSDNEEAEIHVGENVPFISKQDTTAAGITSNIIERADVGIQLKITPQINEGDYISLDIYQETSDVLGGQSDTILTTVGPAISKRSAQTSVVVMDGETVVIGGLMRENDGVVLHKVPILGDIPILGWLFKFRSKTREKVNLLISLTPRIVKDSDDLRRISIEKQKEFDEKSGGPRDPKGEAMEEPQQKEGDSGETVPMDTPDADNGTAPLPGAD